MNRSHVHAEIRLGADGKPTHDSMVQARKDLGEVWENIEDKVLAEISSNRRHEKGDLVQVAVAITLVFGVHPD